MKDIKAIQDIAIPIAREAGALILDFYRRGVRVEYKAEVDIVTEADRTSEKLILARLNQHFPDHSVVAEEGGSRLGDSGFCWYIDPLDGTTNFAHGFPAFCVSMGLEKDGELVVGVVYDPVRDELFTAAKGMGATLNGLPLIVSKVGQLEEALVATGFPSKNRHKNVNIHYYHQISMVSHGVRRAGSAALDLVYVASGRLDCFWEFGLHSWDVAAGALIVTEAGGAITEMTGGQHGLNSPHITATNTLLHAQLLEVFRNVSTGVYKTPLPEISKL